MSPFGLGGLPAPSFQPWLKGRNHDALPLRCVQKRTSCSSTAKCTTQRPNSKSFSRGSRSRWYCWTASVDRLLGQAVLQLEGGDRQAVDEEAQVERELRLVAAVAELPRDAEAVGGVALGGLVVAGRGRAVEEVEVMRAVLDPVAQHVDGAALRDLALQPRQELAPRRPVLVEVERRRRHPAASRAERPRAGRGRRSTRGRSPRVAADPARRRRPPAARGRVSAEAVPGSQAEPVSAVQIRRSRPARRCR